jgi:hypothetical protein
MTRRILCLAALASATLAFSEPAAAGGGVRLSFGGPLGTFVATPTPGYGSSGYAAPRKRVHKATATARTPSVMTADRKRPDRTRVVPVSLGAKKDSSPTSPVTAAVASPGMLGRTLAADSLPRTEVLHTLPPSDHIIARDSLQAEAEPVRSAPAAKEPAKAPGTQEPKTCRKFIPAVGVTVTVGCP